MGPGDYVVRSVSDAAAPYVVYELVDYAGNLHRVMIPRALSTDEASHAALRALVTGPAPNAKPYA